MERGRYSRGKELVEDHLVYILLKSGTLRFSQSAGCTKELAQTIIKDISLTDALFWGTRAPFGVLSQPCSSESCGHQSAKVNEVVQFFGPIALRKAPAFDVFFCCFGPFWSIEDARKLDYLKYLKIFVVRGGESFHNQSHV
jgi:hypothetical protein